MILDDLLTLVDEFGIAWRKWQIDLRIHVKYLFEVVRQLVVGFEAVSFEEFVVPVVRQIITVLLVRVEHQIV